MTTKIREALMPYAWVAGALLIIAAFSYGVGGMLIEHIGNLPETPSEPVLAALVLFSIFSFVSFYVSVGTALPAFVVAVGLGIAAHPLLAPIVADQHTLQALVTICAALILFSGGLEMTFADFRRLFPKIALLALPGVVLTGYCLSFVTQGVGSVLGYAIAPAVVILLGALLASTDPAAIIPVLQDLRFKKRDTKDIVIAESALNDVVGTLLTSVFIGLLLSAAFVPSINGAYATLASQKTLFFLAQQAVFGIIFGILGYLLLRFLSHLKFTHDKTHGADQAYFIMVPIIAFSGATLFGGSGFLAAFVAGLLFLSQEHLRDVEHFFNHTIDGVAKPVIFILVGALVNVKALLVYAPVGILVALVFMFILRPAMVFLALGGFTLLRGENAMTMRELLFVSFVRETGAIPAVLLVTVVASGVAPTAGLVEIGMWVILLTLVIAPPLTPLVARRLDVAA